MLSVLTNSASGIGILGSVAGKFQHCGTGTGSFTAELGLLHEDVPGCREDCANGDGVRGP